MRKALLAGLSVLVILMCSLFALTACNEKVSEISLDKNNMPQIVYVLGNDLDLSKGKLIVGDSSIALNSEGVEVSGYDKNKEGAQTLTITYGGKSTELQITVVPRFQPAEKYVYFIGEQFADAQPRLNITRDDGTRLSVNYSDAALTIENFDTSVAKDTLTLNAKYEKNGEKFEGSFDISVCEPQYTFRAPNKKEYGSHETKLDTTGLSLTIKSPDGSVTRNVRTTDLTFEGFNPAAATAQTPEAKNTITVKYRGNVAQTFEITVKYSDVSRFIDGAAKFSNLDWDCYRRPTSDNPEMALPASLSTADAQEALDLLETYFNFTKDQASYIKKSEIESVAHVALVYGYNVWMNTVKNSVYTDAFTTSASGIIEYVCDTPEKALAAAEKLGDETDEDTALLFSLGDMLTNEIFTDTDYFANTLVYNSKEDGQDVALTMGGLSNTLCDSSYMKKVAQVLEWSVNAYNELKDFASPADHSGWLTDEMAQLLKDNAVHIDEAYTTLTEINENAAMSDSIYPLINGWREQGDFFEILYRYYVADYLDDESEDPTSSLTKVSNLSGMMLPLPLNELRIQLNSAYAYQFIMQYMSENYDPSNPDTMLLMESTAFIIEYRNAEKATLEFLAKYITEDETSSSFDATYIFLYQAFLNDTLNEIYSGDFGYSQLLDSSIYDDDVLGLWTTYTELFLQYTEDNELITAETEEAKAFQAKVGEMFKAFANLMPNEQYNFLSSLNFMYSEGLPSLALYPIDGYLGSDFANFIYTYYAGALNINLTSDEEDTAYNVFTSLLLAMEGYANVDIEYFCTNMADAIAAHDGEWVGGLKDSAKFDELLGDVYNKYLDYYNMFKSELVPVYEIGEDGKPVVDEDGNYVQATDENGDPIFEKEWSYDESELGDNMGGYADEFKNLEISTANVSLAQTYIDLYSGSESMGMEYFLPFLASYEQMLASEKAILESGSEAVINAYYNMPFGSGISAEPLYNSVYDARTDYINNLSIMGLSQEEYEKLTGLRAFLAENASYFWTSLKLQMTAADAGSMFIFAGPEFEFTAENVTAITTAVLSLTPDEQFVLLYMDSTINLYHGGFVLAMEDIFEVDTQNTLLQSLMNLEITYIGYNSAVNAAEPDDETVATYKEEMLKYWDATEDIYENQLIVEEDKNEFDSYFGYVYNFLKDVCTALEGATV